MSVSFWPIEIQARGLTSCGAVLWRYRDRLHVTAVVKAVFSILPEGPMELAAPEPVLLDDQHYDDDPRRSVRSPGELAPYCTKADVLITGQVFAQADQDSRGLDVRVAILRKDKPIIDKSIHVIGDRIPGFHTPRPFTQMSLAHERAFGGPGWDENPVGTGAAPGSAAPNLIDPFNPNHPVGFGPIPRAWPARARLIAAIDPGALARTPLEIPSNFDWNYFQSAPPDQRCDYLRGNEWIVLDNVYATHPKLRTRIPGAKGIGKVHGLDDEQKGRALNLNADSLHIDTARGRCSITWRASLPLPDESALTRLRITVGVELEGEAESLPLPAPPPPAAAAPPARSIDRPRFPSFEGTMVIEPGDIGGEMIVTAPFAPTAPASEPAPSSIAVVPLLDPSSDLEITVPFLNEEEIAAAPAPAPSPLVSPLEGTLDLTNALLLDGPTLPFRSAPPRADAGAARAVESPPRLPSAAEKMIAASEITKVTVRVVKNRAFEGTLDLTDADSRGGLALPFALTPSPAAPPAPPAAAAPSRSKAFAETITVVDGEIVGLMAPFVVAAPSEALSSSAAPIPGAPWSGVPRVEPSPPLSPREPTGPLSTTEVTATDFSVTQELSTQRFDRPAAPPPPVEPPLEEAPLPAWSPLDSPIEEPATNEMAEPTFPEVEPASEPTRTAPAPAPSEPKPSPPPQPTAWSWAPQDPAEAQKLQPPPKPKAPPAPDMGESLYQGFAKKKKKK